MHLKRIWNVLRKLHACFDFGAGGRQFVAVPTGIGVFRAMTAVLYPDIYQPTGGQALYVFELAEGAEGQASP